MQALPKVLVRAERAATAIGCLLLLTILLVVCLDVFMRYVLRSPILWVYDFVSLYAMTGIFFLALAPAYREGAHVGVDILIERLGARARIASRLLGDLVGLALFVPIFWAGIDRTWTSLIQSEVMAGLIAWPTWLSNGVVPLGTALLTLRLLVNALRHALWLLGSGPHAPPPAAHGGSTPGASTGVPT